MLAFGRTLWEDTQHTLGQGIWGCSFLEKNRWLRYSMPVVPGWGNCHLRRKLGELCEPNALVSGFCGVCAVLEAPEASAYGSQLPVGNFVFEVILMSDKSKPSKTRTDALVEDSKTDGKTSRETLEQEMLEANEEICFADLAPAFEFMCWTVVALAPFLRWVNGAAVTDDQWWIQVFLFGSALTGALSLRIYQMVLRRKPKIEKIA